MKSNPSHAGNNVSVVVAMTSDYVIGYSNQLPWRLSIDLKRFRMLTLNHSLIMGRKTFESIGRGLPQRRNIVVSRGPVRRAAAANVEWAASLPDALRRCEDASEVFVIGGGELYRAAMPMASRIYLTLIEVDDRNASLFEPIRGDAFFPPIGAGEWAIDRLGRRNVARPKGKPARPDLRSIYFRFIDLVRILAADSSPAGRPVHHHFAVEEYPRRGRRQDAPR